MAFIRSTAKDPRCMNIGTSDCFAKVCGRCTRLKGTSFKHRKDRRCPFYKPMELYKKQIKGEKI